MERVVFDWKTRRQQRETFTPEEEAQRLTEIAAARARRTARETAQSRRAAALERARRNPVLADLVEALGL